MKMVARNFFQKKLGQAKNFYFWHQCYRMVEYNLDKSVL